MTPENKIYEDLTAMHEGVGVLATMGGFGQPQAASMYFIFDSALNFYFITRESSRKCRNMKRNPRVAFVVSSINPPITVQLEGSAHEVTDPHEENEYFTKLVSVASKDNIMPPISQLEDGRMLFMKISPDWIRSGNFEILKEGDRFVEATLD